MRIRILILLIIIFTLLFISAGTEWTVATLKEYCDTRFNALDKAVTKQEAANEERFRGVNEFRLTLSDQQRTLMPRSEAEGLISSLSSRLEVMESELNKMQATKSGGNSTIAYVIAIISTLVAIAIALRKWNIGGLKQ